jgi:hypothetical protein
MGILWNTSTLQPCQSVSSQKPSKPSKSSKSSKSSILHVFMSPLSFCCCSKSLILCLCVQSIAGYGVEQKLVLRRFLIRDPLIRSDEMQPDGSRKRNCNSSYCCDGTCCLDFLNTWYFRGMYRSLCVFLCVEVFTLSSSFSLFGVHHNTSN